METKLAEILFYIVFISIFIFGFVVGDYLLMIWGFLLTILMMVW